MIVSMKPRMGFAPIVENVNSRNVTTMKTSLSPVVEANLNPRDKI